MEKRAHSRVPCDLPVQCQLEGGGTVGGVIRDISVGGAFVEVEPKVGFGQKLKLAFRVGKTDFEHDCIVRWTKPGGFGVQFGLMGARETHELAAFVQAHRSGA